MGDGIYSALSGAMAASQALDTVSNNLANSTTTGFKGERLSFKEALAKAQTGSPYADRQVTAGGSGIDLAQGTVRMTGHPLDAALLGPGFFVVQTKDGEALSRAGAFAINGNGQLSTLDGHAVLGDAGPINVGDSKDVRLHDDGSVIVDGAIADQLRIVGVKDASRLERKGDGLFKPLDPPTRLDTRLAIGAIEQSNVSVLGGMTEVVLVSRTYESMHRAIELFRSIDQKTTSDLGR